MGSPSTRALWALLGHSAHFGDEFLVTQVHLPADVFPHRRQADAFANRMSALTGRPLTLSQTNVTRQVEVLDISADERRKIERLYARDLELHARCREDYG